MDRFHHGKEFKMGQGMLIALICMLITLAAIPLAGLFSGGGAGGAGSASAEAGSGSGEMLAMLVRDAVALAIGAYYYVSRISPAKDPGWPMGEEERRWWSVPELLSLVILVFFGFKAASAIGQIADGLVTHDGASQSLQGGAGSAGVLISVLTLVVVAPLMEEIVVRGLLFRSLRMRLSFGVSAVLSSLVWAVWHGSVQQGVTAFLVGLILSLTYELYRNLWLTIAIHAGNNALALYFQYFPMNTSGGHELGSGQGKVVLLCEIVVAVFFYYKVWKNDPVRGRFSRR